MNEASLKYLIARLIQSAEEVKVEFDEAEDELDRLFISGKKLAYYEMLLTIQNDLYIEDADLAEFGLDINLEKEYA